MKFANPSKKSRQIASSKTGHCIDFPGKGTVPADKADPFYTVAKDGMVFVPVPPGMTSVVRAAGMIPDEEIEEVEARRVPTRPDSEEGVLKQVFEAMDMIVEGAKREDFGANGAPKAKALSDILGWDLNNAEIKDLWVKYQARDKD